MQTYADEDFAALSLREQFRVLAPFAESDPEVARWMVETEALLAENPLLGFEPHPAGKDGRRPQLEFIEAQTPVVAAFAGNRFGKSTVGGVCCMREALPRDLLPDLLARTKRFDGPTSGWIMVPTEDKIDDSFLPVFHKWCPPSELHGGSWGKAYKGDSHTLRFKNGSTIGFKTYKQDATSLGGAALHYVLYDEPPPKAHREEGMMRLADYGGFEMFAMTPLKANTGYVRREIWKKRESPDITVVKGSIYDNPTLNRATVDRALGTLTDLWRQAREFGDFVAVGGQIYPDFERCVAEKPFEASFVRSLDVVVGIDPGIRNAAVVWVGFDGDNTAYVFNEVLLQDKQAKDYAAVIKAENARMGLRSVTYVCDPAMRQRGQANAQTVMSALAQHDIFCNPGQNDREAGHDQLRSRMRAEPSRFHVSPRCVGLRDEADEYVGKEPEEGKDDSHLDAAKGNDHRLDALRYAVMERFWDSALEDEAPERNLGWVPGGEMPADPFSGARRGPELPMGNMM